MGRAAFPCPYLACHDKAEIHLVAMVYFQLLAKGFCVFPVEHPVVPAGKGRLRFIIHATNTEDQIQGFIDAIFSWVQEMLEIENGTSTATVSKAADKVYTWMRKENLTGYGLP